MKMKKIMKFLCSAIVASSAFLAITAHAATPGVELEYVSTNGTTAVVNAYATGFSKIGGYEVTLESDATIVSGSVTYTLEGLTAFPSNVIAGKYFFIGASANPLPVSVSDKQLIATFELSFEDLSNDITLSPVVTNDMEMYCYVSGGGDFYSDDDSLAVKGTTIPGASKPVIKDAIPVATYTDGEDADVQTFKAYIAAADVAKTLTWTVYANGDSKSDTANIDTNIGGDIEEVVIGLIVQGPSAASATATITVE